MHVLYSLSVSVDSSHTWGINSTISAKASATLSKGFQLLRFYKKLYLRYYRGPASASENQLCFPPKNKQYIKFQYTQFYCDFVFIFLDNQTLEMWCYHLQVWLKILCYSLKVVKYSCRIKVWNISSFFCFSSVFFQVFDLPKVYSGPCQHLGWNLCHSNY